MTNDARRAHSKFARDNCLGPLERVEKEGKEKNRLEAASERLVMHDRLEPLATGLLVLFTLTLAIFGEGT